MWVSVFLVIIRGFTVDGYWYGLSMAKCRALEILVMISAIVRYLLAREILK